MLLQPATILHPGDAGRADGTEVWTVAGAIFVIRAGQHGVALDQRGVRALQLDDDGAQSFAFVQLDRKFEAAVTIAELCLEQILAEAVHLAAADAAAADKG